MKAGRTLGRFALRGLQSKRRQTFTPLPQLSTAPPTFTAPPIFHFHTGLPRQSESPPQPLFTNKFHRLFRLPPKSALRRAGLLLCSNATQNVSVLPFMQQLQMPDSYYSWFLISELHVWLMCARLSGGDMEQKQAKVIRNLVIFNLWEEATLRSKKLGHVTASIRQDNLLDLNDEFQLALILYDAGIVGDDKVLANALWRRFLLCKPDPNMEDVIKLVSYVRSTAQYLESIPIKTLCTDENFKWLPFGEVH